MMNTRANNFGTFLQTMNVGKAAAGMAAEFDLEASAKQALHHLSDKRSGQSNLKDLRDALQINPEQLHQVLSYLTTAGMVEMPREDAVVLTGFGRDALGVFAVA